MNSADKRIEELLNRAGQTISDLPKPNKNGVPYGIDKNDPLLKAAADFTQFNAPAGLEAFNSIKYALHLIDIIDRLEWALENVCGERDYLAYRIRRYRDCQSCERVYECERTPDHCLGCVFGGVPEDWSVDDE